MNTLDECREWYQAALATARGFGRLADKFWDDLPWDDDSLGLGRDNVLRHLEREQVVKAAEVAQTQLDDLAIVLMFSVFEKVVRSQVADQLRRASGDLTHPVLKGAARETIHAVERLSLARLLDWYSQGGHADLAERVRQVRQRRNWISHGRPDAEKPPPVSPAEAHQRLSEFLALVAGFAPDPV